MPITLKAAGTYVDYTTTTSISIPGSPADGDRMFLHVASKDYAATFTTPSGWTAIGTEYTDGSVTAGNGTGSVKVMSWYRDWVSGDSGPTLSSSDASDGGMLIIQVWQKDAGESWGTPLTTNAAWTLNTAATPQTVTAVGSLAVPDNSVVMALFGIRDDNTTPTWGSDGIDVASGIAWNGNYVESPASYYNSSAANDFSGDLGHRFVTTGGTVTLRLTSTLSTAETGAIKFIVQGITTAPALESEILRPIDGLEEDAANTTWQDIDDVVTQPSAPGSLDYLEYPGTSITTYTEKWLVEPPTSGYVIRKATLWVLARSAQALPVMYMNTARAKLNGTWYELTPLSHGNLSPVGVLWHQFEVTGISESSDSADIGFELTIYSSGSHVDQKAQIDAAYLELDYVELAPAAGGFFAWW